MANEGAFFELEEKNFEVDEHRCKDYSAASSSLLEDQDESADVHGFIDDDEEAEENKWRVGPGYLVCLTIGTGG